MKSMKSKMIIFLINFLLMSTAAMAQDVLGTWKYVYEKQEGTLIVTFEKGGVFSSQIVMDVESDNGNKIAFKTSLSGTYKLNEKAMIIRPQTDKIRLDRMDISSSDSEVIKNSGAIKKMFERLVKNNLKKEIYGQLTYVGEDKFILRTKDTRDVFHRVKK